MGDAKRWDRPLDKRIVNSAPDGFTNANPCFQIDYYLRRTGRVWGMVSNGQRWRLYHRDISFRLDVFCEVGLAQLIEQGDLTAFGYFYLFFRATTFQRIEVKVALALVTLSEAKSLVLSKRDSLRLCSGQASLPLVAQNDKSQTTDRPGVTFTVRTPRFW